MYKMPPGVLYRTLFIVIGMLALYVIAALIFS